MDESSQSSFDDPARLDKIDKLIKIGVGEYVSLPQLVVVGDQSSGKSSVLEGLTGLPFPRDSTLCTRFATRIVFCREHEENLFVSLIPAKSSSEDRTALLKGWDFGELRKTPLTMETFTAIINSACNAMGVPQSWIYQSCVKPGPAFSEDILQIEVTGPDKSHFSVMDIPGIFRSPIPGVTTDADKELVKRMVKQSIKDKRTIILAVLPANVDIATQEILEFAKEADPLGVRTLGVLTKPDLVDQGSESDVIQLLEGKKKPLRLGYSIVRNRKQNEHDYSLEERHLSESEFFQDGPFSIVHKDQVGIPALLRRLQDLLRHITEQTFPQVCEEIGRQLDEAKKELTQLGPSRTTEHEQRSYLMKVAGLYQQAALYAITAQYSYSDCLRDNSHTRLATRLVDLNLEFSASMHAYGSAVPFLQKSGQDNGTGESTESNISTARITGDHTSTQETQASGSELSSSNENDDDDMIATPASEDTHHDVDEAFHGLEHLIGISPVEKPRRRDILKWLTKEYRGSRGFELGTFNPAVMSHIFTKLTNSWEPLTRNYVAQSIKIVHQFSYSVLRFYIRDEKVRNVLLGALSDGFKERYRQAYDQADFLLAIERNGNLITTNHYFAENIVKAQRGRQLAQITKFQKLLPFDDKTSVLDEAAFIAAPPTLNDEYNVQIIHDTLESYYKVARKRFVDYICMQAVDYHLVSGPNACLRLFSPEFVLGLTREQVQSIACESPAIHERRLALQKRIKSLDEGMAVLYS